MGFLQTLTDQEQSELKGLCQTTPLVGKLCHELSIYEKDTVNSFYSALTKGIDKITADIHNGTLSMDDPFTKSLIKLAESGDKIFSTLQRGKMDATGEKIVDDNKEIKARSLLDMKSDETRKNI